MPQQLQLMKKTLIAISLIGISLPAFSQNNCSTIKQDKQRLTCYDAKNKTDLVKLKSTESLPATSDDNLNNEIEFKKSALLFIRDAQSNLAISALQWKNWLANSQTTDVSQVLTNKNKFQVGVNESFSILMSRPGHTDKLSEKIKDFYSAWKLAMASIAPMQSDSARSANVRIDETLRNMDAAAERIKMDLQ